MTNRTKIQTGFAIALVASAFTTISVHAAAPTLVDSRATPETVALFQNLKRLSADHVLFGHQAATEYGHGWYGDANRSDVKSVVGSHPAVIGEDFSGLSGDTPDEIAAYQAALEKRIIDTYNRGGITTASWHFNNPITPQTRYAWKPGESAAAVPEIIPGGAHHAEYCEILRTIAEVAHRVRGADGTLAPIIFRPYHEFDGNWFWWGKAHCTREEFVALWQFTVSYLRDDLGVHNFLYAFSPDVKFDSEADYLERYPGDAWVDLVGFDDYADYGRDGRYNLPAAEKRLRIICAYADKTGKVAALTETGLESIPNAKWWTECLLPTLRADGVHVAYALVWRNDQHSPTHFYAPFPGQGSAPDFQRFHDDPFTLFESDLGKIYDAKQPSL